MKNRFFILALDIALVIFIYLSIFILPGGKQVFNMHGCIREQINLLLICDGVTVFFFILLAVIIMLQSWADCLYLSFSSEPH